MSRERELGRTRPRLQIDASLLFFHPEESNRATVAESFACSWNDPRSSRGTFTEAFARATQSTLRATIEAASRLAVQVGFSFGSGSVRGAPYERCHRLPPGELPGFCLSDSRYRISGLQGEAGAEMWGTSRLFSAQSERRYAKQAAEELLELFRAVQREQPGLSGRALYEAVIKQRLGPGDERAAQIVRRAEESFADWPVERALRFRDVVHYLIFDEYIHVGAARAGTKINMGGVISHIIPEEI